MFYLVKLHLDGCVQSLAVQLSDGSFLLLANVYFPIDNGSAANREDLIFVLGELEPLIATQQFDRLMVIGDFNMIFHVIWSPIGL